MRTALCSDLQILLSQGSVGPALESSDVAGIAERREALDGLEAVQKSQPLHPDLILLDIGLPTVNGIEAAREIRKQSSNARILFCSEDLSFEVAGEASRVAAGGYLVKSDAGRDLSSAVMGFRASAL